jgi:trehalose transport system substrate-binding protein
MTRRFRTVLGLMGVLALAATACQQQAAPPTGELAGTTITLSVSLGEPEKAAIQDLLDQFQTETGATVNLTSVTSQDLPPKLEAEVAAGKPSIHLFAQDNLALKILVDKGLVEDLSGVQVPDGVLESMIPDEFDGKQYFLPFRPNVRVAYVNKDRFSAAGVTPPKTVEELRTVAQKFRSAAGAPKVTLSLAQGDPGAVTISEWIISYGGNPLVLNDPGSVQAFEALQAMWKEGVLAPESLLAKFDTEVDNLRGETAWLAQNWPFTSAELSKVGLLEKFDVYEGWNGPDRGAHVIGGDVLGVPKGVTAKEKEAALKLADFLMSKEAQELLAEKNAWPSIRDDAYATVPSDQKETFTAIQNALADGWFRPNVAYWSDASDAMNEAIRRIIQGGEPVKATLDELHAKIEAAAKAKGATYPPS